MKCKFADKPCNDRYFSSTCGHQCRLAEWKKKLRVCPYDKTIKSCSKKKKGQETLIVQGGLKKIWDNKKDEVWNLL